MAALTGGMGRSFHGSYAEYALLPVTRVFSAFLSAFIPLSTGICQPDFQRTVKLKINRNKLYIFRMCLEFKSLNK